LGEELLTKTVVSLLVTIQNVGWESLNQIFEEIMG